jgi:hypothetical protein
MGAKALTRPIGGPVDPMTIEFQFHNKPQKTTAANVKTITTCGDVGSVFMDHEKR